MRTIRKLTPALLKKIILEEKEKIRKENIKSKKRKKNKKLNLSKEQLIELALIHKKQKQLAANFKWLFERKERIKKQVKKKR